jgi:hypothetical protein
MSHYPHMCRDGHAEIGHSDSESEMCPLCVSNAKLAEAEREIAAFGNLLPGYYYMDPPDGGDVSVVEQVRRMAQDAARYRWLRNTNGQHWDDLLRDGGNIMDARIDAAMLSGE